MEPINTTHPVTTNEIPLLQDLIRSSLTEEQERDLPEHLQQKTIPETPEEKPL